MDIIVIPNGAPICCCGPAVTTECPDATSWASVTAGYGIGELTRYDTPPTETCEGQNPMDQFDDAAGGVWYGETGSGNNKVQCWVWAVLDTNGDCQTQYASEEGDVIYHAVYIFYETCSAAHTEDCCTNAYDEAEGVYKLFASEETVVITPA